MQRHFFSTCRSIFLPVCPSLIHNVGMDKLSPSDKVKIQNKLFQIDTSGWTLTDKRFLMALLYLAKDRPAGSVINLTYRDLKKLGIYTEKDHLTKQQITKQVDRLYSHLMGLSLKTYREDEEMFQREQIPLFSKSVLTGKINAVETYVASFKVNPEAMPYLYRLMKGYTSFSLLDYQQLKSLHAQNLFFLLIQFADTGWRKISKTCFLSDMNLTPTYPETDLTQKVLKPAVKELSSIFPDLKVTKIKTGKTVTGYHFTWTPLVPVHRLPSREEFEAWAIDNLHYLNFDRAWKVLNDSKKPLTDWQKYLLGADHRTKKQHEKRVFAQLRKMIDESKASE